MAETAFVHIDFRKIRYSFYFVLFNFMYIRDYVRKMCLM